MLCLQPVTVNSGLSTVQSFTPIDPQPTDYTTCTYILQAGNEISVWPPLTATQGVNISLAIGVVWATAFAFRVLGQFLNHKDERE